MKFIISKFIVWRVYCKTFKVINTISILIDNLKEESLTNSILGDLDQSEELECIIWVTRTYNLRSHLILPIVIQKKLTKLKERKYRKSLLLVLPLPPLSVNSVVNNIRMALSVLVVGNPL